MTTNQRCWRIRNPDLKFKGFFYTKKSITLITVFKKKYYSEYYSFHFTQKIFYFYVFTFFLFLKIFFRSALKTGNLFNTMDQQYILHKSMKLRLFNTCGAAVTDGFLISSPLLDPKLTTNHDAFTSRSWPLASFSYAILTSDTFWSEITWRIHALIGC